VVKSARISLSCDEGRERKREREKKIHSKDTQKKRETKKERRSNLNVDFLHGRPLVRVLAETGAEERSQSGRKLLRNLKYRRD
jgi:hypothetical protein